MGKESIDLLVRANASQFNKEIKKSDKNLNSFKQSANKGGGKFAAGMKAIGPLAKKAALGIAGLTVAAAAATVALLKLGLSQMNELDSLAKTSRKIGISTEALAALRMQANQAGFSSEKLDNNLQKLARGSADAARGTGEAQVAFKRLGLDAKQLSSLPVDQQMEQITEAMGGVTNANEKVSLAFAMFGRSGVDMLNLMDGGTEGLKHYREESERLGLAVSETQIAKVEKANDSWDSMKKSIKGLGNSIAIMIAPMVEWIGKKLTDSIVWAREVFEGWKASIVAAAKIVGWAWDNLGKIWDLAVSKIALSLLTMWEDLKNLFGNTIPTLFTSFGSATLDFFANLASNIGNAITEIWDYITSAGNDKIDLTWQPLTDSFKDAMKEVASAHNRATTDAEKMLSDSIGKQEKEIMDDLANRLAGGLDPVKKQGEKAGKRWGQAFEDEAKKATKALTPNSVAAGTQEAFNVIFDANKAQQSDPAKQMVNEQKASNEKLSEIEEHIRNGGLAVANMP